MKSKFPSLLAVAVLAAAALAFAAPAGAQIIFEAQLSGAAEVPPNPDSPFFGSCTGTLSGFPDGDPMFELSCSHNVVDPTLAHIHIGPPGVAGPPVVTLDPNDIDATWDLTLDEAIRLLGGGYYVNVHTVANPPGEIRGQLEARQSNVAGVEVLRFDLSGDQEVPPVATDASGSCVAFIERAGEPEEGTLDLYCTHDVPDATMAHIHSGAVGEDGPVVVNLGNPNSPIVVEDIVLDEVLAGDLRDGLLYVNVHTPANPGGEIRGQLTGCFESPFVLCLANDRFAVTVDWATEQGGGGSGQGVAVSETDNTGMFWFFEPSNLELMVKVLDGCVVNDHFWVFFAGLTNVEYTLTVTDTVSGNEKVYPIEGGGAGEPPVLDNIAFDTCDVP
jgi:hypothetical protein